MEWLLGLVSTFFWVVIAALLAGMARRILGVPVSWVRAVLVGLVLVGASAPTMVFIAGRTGLVVDGRFVGSPGTAFVLTLLTLAWMFALGLAALVIVEALVPTGAVPGPVALWRTWRDRRRRARRYAVIVGIAVRHGLGRFVRPSRRSRSSSSPSMDRTAVALRKALEDCGVAFVKLGQMLSTRHDLLPAALVRELSKLQTSADAAPWQEIESAIAAEFGKPVDTVFESIDPNPLAAASVGQVHAARLADGADVVVKVQRPTARRQLSADVDIILRLAERLDRVTAWGRALGVRRLAEGFAESLREELDYTVERENTHAVAASIGPADPIVVPRLFPDLCGETVLVMERLHGEPVVDAAQPGGLLAGVPAAQRHELASTVLASVLRQILVSGVFHADLHPGNVLVLHDGTVGLLDFGSVGRLDRVTRNSLGMLLAAVDRDDPVAATSALVELLGRPDDLEQRELERGVGELVVRFATGTPGGMGVFTALLRLVLAHRFSVPPQIAAAFRTMGSLEGTLTLVSPEFDVVQAARTVGSELMQDAYGATEVRRTLESQLAVVLPTVQRLPQRMGKIVEDLENGRFTVNVRPFANESDRRFVTGLVQQLMTAILAAAAMIGAILLLTADTGPRLAPSVGLYAVLGYALLFVGFVLGLRVLAVVFFRPYGSERSR